MAPVNSFRTAIGGFNRDDVVEYIEHTTLEYEKTVRKLRDEQAHLQAELDCAKSEQLRLQAELDAKMAENQKLQNALSVNAPQAPVPAPEAPVPVSKPDYCASELEAYRRAEAAERLAMARVGKIHRQLEMLSNTTITRLRASGDAAGSLCHELTDGLQRLHDALSEVQSIFDEAVCTMQQLDLPQDE